jgi:O-antigen ligase
MQTASSRFSLIVLSIAVAGSPLLVGSTTPSATALWCFVLAVGLALADPAPLRPDQRRWLWLAVVVVAAYAVVLLAQMLPPSLSGLAPYPLWQKAESVLGQPLQPSVAIVRDQPFFAIGSPLAVLMAGLLGYFVGIDRTRAKTLFEVIAWSGAVLALFAIVSHVINPNKLFWWDKTAYYGSLTTPFVNRNAAAMYYGMCGVVGALLFWHMLRQQLPSGRLKLSAVLGVVSRTAHFRTSLRAARPVLCVCAVLLTASRAGTVLALAGQVLAFTLFFWRDLPRRVGPVAALVLGGFVALIVLQLLGGSAGNRFNEHGLVDEGRLDTYRSTLRMIADFPWLGVGLGGFPFAFPLYRTGNLYGTWDRAHNVLLEIAAEGGVPLAAVVMAAWILILLLLAYGIRNRRRDSVFPVAALTVAVIALFHAMIDFSLQAPGFAIPAMALIGTGAAQSFATRRSSDEICSEISVLPSKRSQSGPRA